MYRTLPFKLSCLIFKNLLNIDLPNKFSNIHFRNIIEMANLLVVPSHKYGRGAIQLSTSKLVYFFVIL